MNGRNEIEAKETPSSIAGRTSTGEGHQENLSNLEGQSDASKRVWPKPTNIKELAAITNEISILVLNGDIDLGVASKFATLARTTAQLKSLEAAKARQDKTKINLSL
jgi:hypothetical protein